MNQTEEKIKFSVVLPIYNVEKYLNRCLDSVMNQTYKKLEIILVDDGSPDNSPQMCDNWAKVDDRIKVVHKKNAGLGEARNSGLDVATGDYIVFFDSDDYIDTRLFEELYTVIISDIRMHAFCKTFRINRGGRDDYFQIGSFWQKLFQISEQKIDIQAAFMRFIDDNRVVLFQETVVLAFCQQYSVGHQFDGGSRL